MRSIRDHPWTGVGAIDDDSSIPNLAGDMIAGACQDIRLGFPTASPDACVVMPNHIHGIVSFVSDAIKGHVRLGDVMKWFKTILTEHYVHGVWGHGWPRFDEHLWQRNCHEHVVGSEADMVRLREDIAANPAGWGEDRYHATM